MRKQPSRLLLLLTAGSMTQQIFRNKIYTRKEKTVSRYVVRDIGAGSSVTTRHIKSYGGLNRRYTSAQANKLLRKITGRKADLESKERKSSTFRVASGEDAESLRPKYDFASVQAELDKLEDMTRKVKHAINVFNTTHVLDGFDGLTIDQALVYIPQLSSRVSKLREMAGAIPKRRIDDYRNNFVDYSVVNYDIEEAEQAYKTAQEKLAAMQLALDTANASETMEIDVELD